MRLNVATGQFPISDGIYANCHYVLDQLTSAKRQGANVIHFPEACLSGYAGVDFESFDSFDWKALQEATQTIMSAAAKHNIWVILCSGHYLSDIHKPHNCMYIIDNNGNLIDRYDKRYCSGNATGTTGDLAHYTPGNHFSVFDINGVTCGVLICYGFRFPELYREYKQRGYKSCFMDFMQAMSLKNI